MLEEKDVLAVEYAEEAWFPGHRRRIQDKEARGDEYVSLRIRRHGRLGDLSGRSPREGEGIRPKDVGRVVRENGGNFGQKRGRCFTEGDSFSIGGESIVAGGGGALRVIDSGDARPTFSFCSRMRIPACRRFGRCTTDFFISLEDRKRRVYWIAITDVSRTCSKLSSKQSKLQSLRGSLSETSLTFDFYYS